MPRNHTAHAEKLIQESKLTSSTVSLLNQQFQKAIHEKVTGNAGWHGATDIKTLDGLAGTFLWTEDPLKASNITFKFNPGQVGSDGTYAITYLQNTIEQGSFHCTPNNPAIGWAFILLDPEQNPSALRSFIVSGMFTDNEWKIIIALLNKVGDKGPLLPPFSAVRIS
ncbi:hypothetical protein [Paraherbaspirillum soli]|uniref:Uncharacterized protein n=1 Tax=Paraherbaspirillum soli TaxID=631222 RepID=A0ABW0ME94_9BURK